MKQILTNRWFKLVIAELIMLLMIIWIGNYWLLFLLPIVFDVYITKKVHWAFWKKRGVEKQNRIVEWIDAIIFAVVAATIIRIFFIEAYTIPTSSMEKTLLVGDYLFVSKAAYGPKLPNTPLSFPLVHHTLPGTKHTKSYLEWIKCLYKRLAGYSHIKRNDIVVFNFPAGDTVVMGNEKVDYYTQIRSLANSIKALDMQKGRKLQSDKIYQNIARKRIKDNNQIIVRPVDKKENYIKRCVAMPGDKIESKDGQLFINGKKQEHFNDMQFKYRVTTNGTSINPRILRKMHITKDEIIHIGTTYEIPLTAKNASKIENLSNVISIKKMIYPKGTYEDVFPFSSNYNWNRDNFGPFVVPKAGETVELNMKNLLFYRRIIHAYEHNKLKVQNNKIYINDKEAHTYTFKMNYYWMMGDNRHMSADSRYWGFVPEDHIVGKASFIWLSIDPEQQGLFNKIRWNRIFNWI